MTLDARHLLGMATTDLLARANLTVLTGTQNTQFGEASPTANRTYDARTKIFEAYFDVDAIYPTGRTNGTNTTALTGYYVDDRTGLQWKGRFCNQAYLNAGGAIGSMINVDTNAHYINQRPIRLGYTTPAVFPAIIGGKVVGMQPSTLSWNGMKHGSYIQDLINGGWTGAAAWAEIIDNANQDGDARFHIAAGSTGIVDGLRGTNLHDGFGIYGDGVRTSAGQVYIRNCWFRDVHDDGIENDEQRSLHVFDCLIENCYTFLSTRADDTSGTPQTGKNQVVEDCIVTFKAWPGPYQQPQTNTGHDLLYKMQTNSPYLQWKNVILAPVKFRDPDGTGPQLPVRSGDTYENVTICWLGTGTYPGNIPTGCTLQTGITAQTTVNNAVASWKNRHGVTNFDNVDMSKMIDPDLFGVTLPGESYDPFDWSPTTPIDEATLDNREAEIEVLDDRLAALELSNPSTPSGLGQLNLAASSTTSTAGTGLNDAIAALPAAGGTIIIPSGTWTIDTAVLINKNGVVLRGISPGATKLQFNGSTIPIAIKMADTTQRYVTIQDLSIESTANGVGTAIDASYFVNSQFHRLRIGSAGVAPNKGIDFNTVGTYYNTVRDCRITVAGVGSRCLSFDNIANSNWVDNVRLFGDANTVGVYVNAHANTLAHIDCETTMAIGVQVEPTGNDCMLIAPYLEQVDVGVQLASGVEAFTCLGGVIIDSDVNNIVDNGAKDPVFINTRLQYEPYTSFTARSPAFPQSYPIQTGQAQPQDHGLISWSSDPTMQNTGTVFTNGTVYLTKVYVRNRATLTNIHWWVATAGVTPTSGQNEVGIYNSSGTRLISANVDASITSTGLKSTAVTSTVLPAGWYWVAFVFNAATPPALMRGNGAAGVTTAMNIGLTASFLRYATNGTVQTVLPATITPSSNAATAFAGPWAAIG
jgi:hypothetical protein